MKHLQHILSLPKKDLTFSFSILISLLAANLYFSEASDDVYLYCDGQMAYVTCENGRTINIAVDSVSYGLLEDNTCDDMPPVDGESTTPQPDVARFPGCISRQRADRVVRDRCQNMTACEFLVSDDVGFVLSECPYESVFRQLKFNASCVSVIISTTSTTTEELPVENITTIVPPTPTSRPLPRHQPSSPGLPCLNGSSKVEDCFHWLCEWGKWRKTAVFDLMDPVCCASLHGCEINSTNQIRPTPALQVVGNLTYKDCPPENTTGRFDLSWTSTAEGRLAALPCPGDPRESPSSVRRKCKRGGIWEQEIDTSMCSSHSILQLFSKTINSESDLEELTVELAESTKAKNLTSADITSVAAVLENVGVNINKFKNERSTAVINVTQKAFEAGENILDVGGNRTTWKNVEEEDRSSKAMEVVDALEYIARETAAVINNDLTVQTESIELKVKVVQLQNVSDDYALSVNTGGGVIQFPSSNLVANQNGAGYGKLVTVFYNSTAVWSSQNNRIINTPVFSATVLDSKKSRGPRRELKTPFIYTLYHQKNSSASHQCVYWNSTQSNWSGEGCRRTGGSDSYSSCECNHLTNFAVLLDVQGVNADISPAQELALRIITYVGCTISIICLLLAWLTFQFLKNLSSDRNTIHKHLVFSLMLAEALFLVAISPQVVQLKVVCAVLAGTLHFLFLAVFAWTCLEGVQLYIMLIEVFESERSRIVYYYLAGYGIPAVVVVVSAAVNHQGYGTERVCWLQTQNGFIWSFVGPVAAVMVVNIVMLGVAIYMMYNHAKMVANMKHKETSRLDNFKAWLKGAVVLVVLLGLTWVFGFMYVSDDTEPFAYAFTILNSLQGVFIFIFHCFGNEKVQKEYKKYVRRTQWLPNCIRVNYGEHRGLSSVPSHSSGSNGYLSKYFSRRRKSSDLINGSLRSKKQISGLTSINSNGNIDDDNYISKAKLHHKSSSSSSNRNECNEQDVALATSELLTPSLC